MMGSDFQAVVDAVHDLTRVLIATQGNFGSKADVIRRLADLSIPPTRIATISIGPRFVSDFDCASADLRESLRCDYVRPFRRARDAIDDV